MVQCYDCKSARPPRRTCRARMDSRRPPGRALVLPVRPALHRPDTTHRCTPRREVRGGAPLSLTSAAPWSPGRRRLLSASLRRASHRVHPRRSIRSALARPSARRPCATGRGTHPRPSAKTPPGPERRSNHRRPSQSFLLSPASAAALLGRLVRWQLPGHQALLGAAAVQSSCSVMAGGHHLHGFRGRPRTRPPAALIVGPSTGTGTGPNWPNVPQAWAPHPRMTPPPASSR